MLNLLVSYAYLQTPVSRDRWLTLIEATRGRVRWMLDSGGFTIANLGLSISVEDYIAALKDGLADAFWQYVALDRPGDWSESRRRWETMVAAGLRPMGVLTADAAVTDAADLVAVNKYLCLAGGTMEESEWYLHRVASVYASTRALIHGLGFTRRTEAARARRLYSIDSSTFAAGARYGNLSVFVGFDGCKQVNCPQLLRGQRKPSKDILDAFAKYGLRITDLRRFMTAQNGSRSNGTVIDMLTVLAWLEYAEWMRRVGVRFFFATTNYANVASIAQAMEARVKRWGVEEMAAAHAQWWDLQRQPSKAEFNAAFTEVTAQYLATIAPEVAIPGEA